MAKRAQQDSVPGLLEAVELQFARARAVAGITDDVLSGIGLDEGGVAADRSSLRRVEDQRTATFEPATGKFARSNDYLGVLP